ncbi:MAG: hypothetical protein ACOYN3_04850 [Acidimicrobiia bacterium]
MRTRVLVLPVAVVAAAVLGACSASTSSSAPTTTSAEKGAPATVNPSTETGLTFDPGYRLQPSDFGVPAGQPVADVSVIQLPDGSVRAYVFAQGKGIVSATSKDGITFTPEPGVRLRDGNGMPRAMRQPDGSLLLFAISGGGVNGWTSTDGLTFTQQANNRINPPAGVPQISGVSTPVRTKDGRWRVYFSDLPIPGEGPKPHTVYSAVSPDLATWTVEPGTRIGGGTTVASGEHPDAIAADDGTVTMYFFVNNPMDLWSATSDDGLTFSNAQALKLNCNDPSVLQRADSVRKMYCGQFKEGLGGVVLSATL